MILIRRNRFTTLQSMLRTYLIFFQSVLAVLSVYAQEEDKDLTVNRQFWTDFNQKYEFNEKSGVSGFLGYRSISPNVYDKWVLSGTYDIRNNRGLAFLKLKKPLVSSFHLGGGLFYTDNKDEKNNFEFRMSQGLKFFIPLMKFIPIQNYFRIEERFQKTFGGSSWNTSVRLRYRVATVIEWEKRLFAFNKGMYIPVNVEFFYSLSEAKIFNDVIRISPGVGYKLNDEWRAELYFSYHYTNNTSEQQDGSNDFVVRLRIFKANLVKKPPMLDTKEEDMKELIE